MKNLIPHLNPAQQSATAFACSNIALCKYWGKRDSKLNLPINSSLSISLADKGATATIKLISAAQDQYAINNKSIPADSSHFLRLKNYFDLFRVTGFSFELEINLTIPLAAGLASSAAIFAAIAKALDKLFAWQLDNKNLSILARFGSGSAARSIEEGFVEWRRGEHEDGLDSFAEKIDCAWPDFRVGLCLLTSEAKKISSRAGMQSTVETSILYQAWPAQVAHDLPLIKQAIHNHDFELLGKTAENNALAMHATMLASQPPLLYSTPETIQLMQKIWRLRSEGLKIYFTQDAGPNLKLLFLKSELAQVQECFANIEIVVPFKGN